MRYLIAPLLLVGAMLITGCSETDPAAAETVAVAVNSICPIMGHEVTDDGGRVDFNGETVGFCCPGCIDKWNALSDDEKAEQLKNPPSDDHEGHDDDAHNHEGHGSDEKVDA